MTTIGYSPASTIPLLPKRLWFSWVIHSPFQPHASREDDQPHYKEIKACIQTNGAGNGNPLQYSCLENPMEPGGLQPMRSQRVGHNWATNAFKEHEETAGRTIRATATVPAFRRCGCDESLVNLPSCYYYFWPPCVCVCVCVCGYIVLFLNNKAWKTQISYSAGPQPDKHSFISALEETSLYWT